MEEIPLCTTPHPGALSMETHNLDQRSDALSEKMFGQEVHAPGDRGVVFFSRCIFFSCADSRGISTVRRAARLRIRDASR
jgi:hypothetical protein